MRDIFLQRELAKSVGEIENTDATQKEENSWYEKLKKKLESVSIDQHPMKLYAYYKPSNGNSDMRFFRDIHSLDKWLEHQFKEDPNTVLETIEVFID